MICIQFVSQDMDAEGKGIEQKSEKDCIVMSYMALHLESQTTHPLRGFEPADCHPTLDRRTCL